MKPLGLGMIGLHHQHPRWYFPLWAHLDTYQPRVICDDDPVFLESENEFFDLDTTTDYHEVLARDDVDVVIIWLEHSRMPDAVAAAAEAGKHVIVEKPGAANVAGAKRIVETAAAHPNIRISSPYCWRTHLVSDQIRDTIAAGHLGQLFTVEGRLNAGGAHRYIRDNAPWMLTEGEGGGPMWNLGVHWVDYFRAMTGQEIVQVAGVAAGPWGDPPRHIEDSAQALLKFDSGATGILDISYTMPTAYPGARDIFVSFRGTTGDITWAPAWEGVTDEVLIVSEADNAPEPCRRIAVTSPEIPGYCGHMAWAWLNDFAQAVDQQRDPIATPHDILRAVQVVDAYYRSLKSGKLEDVEQ
ncbi:MAG: hypothetical protein CMJ49_11920 [Planctomycetaceae bacterium]|nr:hypothetical protein [Planctomycetaceae bacterium]